MRGGLDLKSKFRMDLGELFMTKYLTRITLLAMLLFCFASTMYAGRVNCASTPSDPACTPTFALSYHPSGGGPTTFDAGGMPLFANGSWLTSFAPQTFSALERRSTRPEFEVVGFTKAA